MLVVVVHTRTAYTPFGSVLSLSPLLSVFWHTQAGYFHYIFLINSTFFDNSFSIPLRTRPFSPSQSTAIHVLLLRRNMIILWYGLAVVLSMGTFSLLSATDFPSPSRGVGCARILFSTLWIFVFNSWWRVCKNLIIKDWKNWCKDLTNTLLLDCHCCSRGKSMNCTYTNESPSCAFDVVVGVLGRNEYHPKITYRNHLFFAYFLFIVFLNVPVKKSILLSNSISCVLISSGIRSRRHPSFCWWCGFVLAPWVLISAPSFSNWQS